MKKVKRICPKCGVFYSEAPAISRIDNETYICPDCGVREALEYLNLPKQEQDKILDIIHKSKEQYTQL